MLFLFQENEQAKPIYSHDKFTEIHELAFQSSGRVKEHAQKLNKIVSQNQLQVPMPNTTNGSSVSNKRRSKECKEDDTDTSSVQPFDPLKRKWMITASNCDYNKLVSLLKEDPNLAGFKVYILIYK